MTSLFPSASKNVVYCNWAVFQEFQVSLNTLRGTYNMAIVLIILYIKSRLLYCASFTLFVNMWWEIKIKNAKVHYLLQNTQSCDQTFIYISLSEQLSISLCCDAFITQVLWMKSGIEIALIYIMDAEASLSRTSVNRYQGTNIYKKTEWNKSYRRDVKTTLNLLILWVLTPAVCFMDVW